MRYLIAALLLVSLAGCYVDTGYGYGGPVGVYGGGNEHHGGYEHRGYR
jgi:hypothetical protein